MTYPQAPGCIQQPREFILAAVVRFLCSSSFFHSRTEGDPRMPCLSFSHGARSSVTPARDGYRPPCHQPDGDTDSRSIATLHCTVISFCQTPHRWRPSALIKQAIKNRWHHGNSPWAPWLKGRAPARQRAPGTEARRPAAVPTLQNQHPSLTQHSTACTRDTRTEHQGSVAPFLLLAHDGARQQ